MPQPLVSRQNNLVPDAPLVQPFPTELAQGAQYTAQFGAELAQSGLDTVARGNQTNAALMERLYETRAQGELAKGAQKAASLATPQSGLGGFILGAAQLYSDIQRRQQQEENARKRQELLLRAAQYASGARTIIQETEGGYLAYNTGAQALAQEYAPLAGKYDENGNWVIDNDDYIQFIQRLYGPAQGVLNDNSDYRITTMRSALDTANESYASRIVTANSINLALIAQETDPVKRSNLIDGLYKSIEEATANMPYPAQVAVLNAVMPEIQKSAQLSATEQVATYRKLSSLQLALTELEQVKKQFAEYGNTEQSRDWYQAQIAAIDGKYGTDLWSKFNDPTKARQDLQELQQQEQTIIEAQNKGLISPAEAIGWTRQHMGVKAFELASDAAAAAQFDSIFIGDYDKKVSPNARAIAALSKQWREYSEWYATSKRAVASLSGSVAALNIASAEDLVKQMQQSKDAPAAFIQSLGILGAFNTNLKDQLGQLRQLASSGLPNPADVQKAYDLINLYRKEAAAAVQAQQKAWFDESVQRFGNLGTYGFDPDPAVTLEIMRKNAPTLKSINEALNKSITEFNRSQPPPGQTSTATGSTPNFKPAPPSQQPANLSLAKLEMEGKTVYVPFPKGTESFFTSPIGPRWGKFHAGVDVAVPVGTPLLFYDSGEIVDARSPAESGGYGYMITVKTPNGRYHRFAHLDSIGVNIGDKVKPGQQIGTTGNTGRSDGPHLHWEIRTSHSWGATDVVSVSEHMSLVYGQSKPREARNGTVTRKMPGTIQIDKGFISGNQLVNIDTSKVKPIMPKDVVRVSSSSNQLSDYTNNPSENYGYAVLAKNNQLRAMFHNAAQKMGVPTQWLVDLWVYENGSPDTVKIRRGNEYTLNHFLPHSKAALKAYSEGDPSLMVQESLRGMVNLYAKYKPANLEYFIASYYQAVSNGLKKGNPVFTGDPRTSLLEQRNGVDFSVTGGSTTFRHVLDNLGRNTGRRYNHRGRTKADIRIHRDAVAGCPMCAQMASSFITHEAFVQEIA